MGSAPGPLPPLHHHPPHKLLKVKVAGARGWGKGGGGRPGPFVRRRGRSPSSSSPPGRGGGGGECRARQPGRESGSGRAPVTPSPPSPPGEGGWGALGPRSSGSRGGSERDGKRGKKRGRESEGCLGEERAGRELGLNPGVQDPSHWAREEANTRRRDADREKGRESPEAEGAPSTLSRGI